MSKDQIEGVEMMIENAHWLVHHGYLQNVSDYQGSVASSTYLIVTGVRNLHIVFRIALSTGGNVVITEGVTATAGTNIPFSSYNRVEQKPFTSTMSRTPTGVSGGTALPPDYIPVDNKGQVQVPVRVGSEYMLKANTKYLLTITALSSGAVNIDADAYEM